MAKYGAVFVALLLAAILLGCGCAQTASAELVELTPSTFDSVVMSNQKNVFVLFYASWCGHCQQLKPTWEALAKEYPLGGDVVIARVDASMHRAIGSANRISGYPTMKMFTKDDKSGLLFKGKRTVEDLQAFVNETTAASK